MKSESKSLCSYDRYELSIRVVKAGQQSGVIHNGVLNQTLVYIHYAIPCSECNLHYIGESDSIDRRMGQQSVGFTIGATT